MNAGPVRLDLAQAVKHLSQAHISQLRYTGAAIVFRILSGDRPEKEAVTNGSSRRLTMRDNMRLYNDCHAETQAAKMLKVIHT